MWTHEKFKNQVFMGQYLYTSKDRVFTLSNGKKKISFESWQTAAEKGWKRIAVGKRK